MTTQRSIRTVLVRRVQTAGLYPYRRACLVMLSMLLACLSVTLPQAAHAATAGTIVSTKAGRCLDVAGGDTAPGAQVIIYDCHGNSNQRWEYTANKELRTLEGTRCLDVTGQSRDPQAFVQSYTCNNQDNQKWDIKSDGTIVGVQSGLCLTLRGGATANLTRIDTWPCQGLAHQKWTVNGVGSGDTQRPTSPPSVNVVINSCRSATVSWTASTDNVGVVAYDIFRDGQALGTVAGNVTSAQVTTTPGATWGFYVNARDAAGNVSPPSASVKKTIPQCAPDTQPPTAPTNLKAVASGTSVTLQWTASTDNIGVDTYDIYRNNGKVASTSNTSFTDNGLAANTKYDYSVIALDAQKNPSPRSNTASATTGSNCTGNNGFCSVKKITDDTDIPWGLVPLPDGKVLYNRRDAGNIVLLDPVNGSKTSIGMVPNVKGTNGEGGLLGLAVTPNFPASDNWLYIFHTSPTDNRIVRIRYINGKLDNTTEQLLLTGIKSSHFHNGGRLRFGPDGKLYASTGDAENGTNAQDKNGLNGKVLRLNADGSPPSDNPFGNYVWSYGHRNPQGLAFDSQGRLWEQEFGDTEDETNLIVKGSNYGWPDCEGKKNRNGSGCGTAGFTAPKNTYSNGEASCSGIAIVRDVLYVACEQGMRLYREQISGSSLTNVTQAYNGVYGRIRTVEPTIDGGLWMTTTNNGDKDSVPDNTNAAVYKVELSK